jgi:hypothetical protein
MAEAATAELEQRVCTVLEEACRRNLTWPAESCTGGLLAALLTDVEGCGHAFDRGFVVYTKEAKHELLGVPAPLLEDPGKRAVWRWKCQRRQCASPEPLPKEITTTVEYGRRRGWRAFQP